MSGKTLLDIPGFKVTEDDMKGVNMFKSRKDELEAEVARMNCVNYEGCAICYKCMAKCGHKFEQCELCQVPLCHHKAKDRYKMIRPMNFTMNTSDIGFGTLYTDMETVVKEYEEQKLNVVNQEIEQVLLDEESKSSIDNQEVQ